ncbi:MAG: transcriptional regulator [Rhodospirillaceae bacterium]|nr:transcriptional regulator [Rhodospirillaceae bacterium]
MVSQKNLYCPVARSANVIGDRWTLLILRDLFQNGRCRFQSLLESLDGIAPNTLSARLKSLEANGIIERDFYEMHPPRAEYLLTEKGRALGPIIRALYKWGDQYGT